MKKESPMAQANNQGSNNIFHQTVAKILIAVCATLLGLLSWFLIEKITFFEKQIDKLDVKIENVTRGQIQIMTNLNIPIPPFYFKDIKNNVPDSTPIPINESGLPNREAEILEAKASKKKPPLQRSKYI